MSGQETRRTFLKQSGVVAGAAASLSIARSAHASGRNELTFALIGCRSRGTGAVNDFLNAAKIVNQPVKLIAMADAFKDRARSSLGRLQKQWAASIDVPQERIFTELDNYQKVIDCKPDIVLMASPPGFRAREYAAAIQGGVHVFMEKPCCLDAPGYRTLVEANTIADQKGLKVVVGLQRHHQASYIRGIQQIHDGQLGDIQFLRVFWNGGGGRDLGPRPVDDPDEMRFQVRNWGCFRWLYGDNIVEQIVRQAVQVAFAHGAIPSDEGIAVGAFPRRGAEQGAGHHASAPVPHQIAKILAHVVFSKKGV